MTRMKHFGVTFAALIVVLLLVLGTMLGVGMAGARASAEEVDPEPVIASPGWYVVGNGAGSLKDCSWQEYRADFKLEVLEPNDQIEYAGIFATIELLLYQGDQFKLLYQDGTWAVPDDSGWTTAVSAGFDNIKGNDGSFSDGGLGNIYCDRSAYYTFYLEVTGTPTSEESKLTITYEADYDREVPSLNLYNMYIVGEVASVTTCNWPDNLTGEATVENSCIKMTDEGDGTWSVTLVLGLEDQFKLYNTVTHTYYPSGFEGNITVTEAGTYKLVWEEGAQTVTLALLEPAPVE